MIALVATILLCGPAPVVIAEPGVYEFCAETPATSPNDVAVRINAGDVTLLGVQATDSRRCIEVRGSRVTIRGGNLARCMKAGVQIIGAVSDVTVEGLTVLTSGNGVLAYSTGSVEQKRILVAGNTFVSMGGAVDGHAVAFQSVSNGIIRGNAIENCQLACISLYWWGTVAQAYNIVETNYVLNPTGTGISAGGSNSEAITKHDNVIQHNTIRAARPMYLKGNRTAAADVWAVEAIGNYAPGESEIGSASVTCPKVYAFNNHGATYAGVKVGC